MNLEAIEERYADYDRAIGPGGDKMWNAAQCARDVPALVAEVKRLQADLNAAQLRSIEASNPGIDMDEVRRIGGYA